MDYFYRCFIIENNKFLFVCIEKNNWIQILYYMDGKKYKLLFPHTYINRFKGVAITSIKGENLNWCRQQWGYIEKLNDGWFILDIEILRKGYYDVFIVDKMNINWNLIIQFKEFRIYKANFFLINILILF